MEVWPVAGMRIAGKGGVPPVELYKPEGLAQAFQRFRRPMRPLPHWRATFSYTYRLFLMPLSGHHEMLPIWELPTLQEELLKQPNRVCMSVEHADLLRGLCSGINPE